MIRLRDIPPVNEILNSDPFNVLTHQFPRHIIKDIVRGITAEIRATPEQFNPVDLQFDILASEVRRRLVLRLKPSLVKVINATGTVLHTNLGRAPLAREVYDKIANITDGYCNLELSLDTGKRSLRTDHVSYILKEITGAEDGIAVNNNAGAVLLALTALAKGREVIISRGELVEIGGGFRIPEVMAASGAILREVGTTNRTHLRDYKNAINENTALILKAHRSNYDIVGFTSEVGIEDLVVLGREHRIPVMFDLGSGCLTDLTRIGLSTIRVTDCIRWGTSLVTFSGDKLLGGPQAGLIVGKKELVRVIARHPLARALRLDKVTLASLEATLSFYRDPETIWQKIPALSLLSRDERHLKRLSSMLQRGLTRAGKQGFRFISRPDVSAVGGGALPTAQLPTWVVEVHSDRYSAESLLSSFRRFPIPVIGRIRQDRLMLDVRTVFKHEIQTIVKGFDIHFSSDSD